MILSKGAMTTVLCGLAYLQASAQTVPTAPAPPKEILFSTAFTERSTASSIIIQTGENEVLVFDAPGPFTLWDASSKQPKKFVIIAKEAVLRAPTVVNSFDFRDDTQRPPVKPSLPAAGHGVDGGDAGNCNAGGSGKPGEDGADGAEGNKGYDAPLVIVDIAKFRAESNSYLLINNKGGTGGQGQNGQQGGDGGRAGRGGDAVDHLLDCACGPGVAGQPAPAGAGGRRGPGGPGGIGGTVLVSRAVKEQYDSGGVFKINVSHGEYGPDGTGGAGGEGGKGATGGSGSSHCKEGAKASQAAASRTGEINSADPRQRPTQNSDGIVKQLQKSAWD